MTDVMKVARDRRAELQDEVARLEEFIEMAESLARDQRLPTGPARGARPAAAIVREAPAPAPSGEPAAASASEEDEGEPDTVAETALETAEELEEEDADEAAAATSGAGLSRINLLRRGPRMVTN